MKQSIKQKILSYLTEKNSWQFGGSIEDFIRRTDGAKASNCSRRCRELENESKIERQVVRLDGNYVVQYRIKQPQFVVNNLRRDQDLVTCCYSFFQFKVHARDCEKVKVRTLL